MAIVNIKQNNIDFTVDNANTSKSWIPSPGSTFAPADLGNDFNIGILKTAEDEGWLDDLRILHGLFIDWNSGKITLNGTTYTINNTGELFSAIQEAGQVSPILNDSNLPIRTSVVTEEFSYLGEAIGELAQIASEKMADWE